MTILPVARLLQSVMLVLGLGLLAACARNDLQKAPVPLGDFVIGHNIVVADSAAVPGISRKVTPDQWEAALTKAMADRFGRYEGSRIYNFGTSVDAYVLAPPGLPIVASPRSAVIITVHVYEDAKGVELNPGGKQLTVLESSSPEALIGSGLTQSKLVQMERLSYDAAKAVQRYLLDNPAWFDLPPTPETTPSN